MKHRALAFSLSLLLLFTLAANAQDSRVASDDTSVVQATVANYIEAYYSGDAARMEQTLHPHYLKHMIHGNIPVRDKTGAQMVSEVRSNGPASLPPADRTEQVQVLDITGDIASAKLITPHWVDYMTLAKSDGKWKILSVVQQIND